MESMSYIILIITKDTNETFGTNGTEVSLLRIFIHLNLWRDTKLTERKLRVGLIFGGRSSEHAVSLISASSVMDHLDSSKYEVFPIGITKEGSWLPGVAPAKLLAAEPCAGNAPVLEVNATSMLTKPSSTRQPMPLVENNEWFSSNDVLDVAFPVLHGRYGEDGTLQGLLEMTNVPYVGCGVMGAALGMDKEKMKMIFRAAGLPVVDSLAFRRNEWERSPENIVAAIERRLNYPCFVKPANSGSSIGVNKARNCDELERAMKVAADYDHKIIVERAINCRELECSVLGNDEPKPSVIGEVIVNNEFYDYQAKYIDQNSHTVVPADVPQETAEEMRRMATQAFLALDLSGLARVDFFLEQETNHIYINEVNTLPSFTPQCMYPKLCEASGLSYPYLLERLIELALERHADRQRNRITL